MKAPKNLKELLANIKDKAKDFGFKEGENGIFRDCISSSSKKTEIRDVKENDANFWFGFVREDQQTGGAYSGLSYVVFPEHDNTRCLVSIGIGSSSIGQDGELASNPGFRRSFMRLVKKDRPSIKAFFSLRFDDMETSTPRLQEEINNEKADYEDVLIKTTTKYNADDNKEAPGLLPAALLVDYSTKEGWNHIVAWLAQYANWRNWDKYKKGTEKAKATKSINDAIEVCKVSAECPTPADIKQILDKHKYVILQGAPGCGKTWSVNKVSETFGEFVTFTQFHAETSYSDFVYGIRPTLDGSTLAYKGVKGVLLEAIEKAEMAAKDNKNALLIIDEINRANLANVLGPVFYLFENDTIREHELKIGTEYDEKKEEEKDITLKKLPDNFYVLATMNTADKSLAVVDFALRRRFAWVTLRPHQLDKKEFPNFDSEFFEEVDKLFVNYATDEELNLQPGQSYFMDKNNRKESIKYGLMPLMKEYFAEGYLLPAKEEFAQLLSSESDEYMYE